MPFLMKPEDLWPRTKFSTGCAAWSYSGPLITWLRTECWSRLRSGIISLRRRAGNEWTVRNETATCTEPHLPTHWPDDGALGQIHPFPQSQRQHGVGKSGPVLRALIIRHIAALPPATCASTAKIPLRSTWQSATIELTNPLPPPKPFGSQTSGSATSGQWTLFPPPAPTPLTSLLAAWSFAAHRCLRVSCRDVLSTLHLLPVLHSHLAYIWGGGKGVKHIHEADSSSN